MRDVIAAPLSGLDLRQHSSHHEAAIAEILGRSDYPKLAEEKRRELLAEALATAEIFSVEKVAAFSAATRNVLDPLRLAAQVETHFGTDALGIHIISMTDDVSDVLELQLLMKLTGAKLTIAPPATHRQRSRRRHLSQHDSLQQEALAGRTRLECGSLRATAKRGFPCTGS